MRRVRVADFESEKSLIFNGLCRCQGHILLCIAAAMLSKLQKIERK